MHTYKVGMFDELGFCYGYVRAVSEQAAILVMAEEGYKPQFADKLADRADGRNDWSTMHALQIQVSRRQYKMSH